MGEPKWGTPRATPSQGGGPGRTLCAGGVARLVGVPLLFAVVAEGRAATGALAAQLGAAGTAARYYHVPAM